MFVSGKGCVRADEIMCVARALFGVAAMEGLLEGQGGRNIFDSLNEPWELFV